MSRRASKADGAASQSKHFAPVPARAMGNVNLSALDLRVLAAIAAHDRFGANGVGCFSSRARLAKLVDGHENSVSRSIATLAQQGLIEVKPHPMNGRARVYRVLYTPFDATYMGVKTGNETVTRQPQIGSETVTENTPIGNSETPQSVTEIAESVTETAELPLSLQRVSSLNILNTKGIHSAEANTSRETGPGIGTNAGVAAMLSMIERGIQAGAVRNGGVWKRYLTDRLADLDMRDPEHARSKRLLEAIEKLE